MVACILLFEIVKYNSIFSKQKTHYRIMSFSALIVFRRLKSCALIKKVMMMSFPYQDEIPRLLNSQNISKALFESFS